MRPEDYLPGYSESELSRLELGAQICKSIPIFAPAVDEAARKGQIQKVLDLACGTALWSSEAVKRLAELSPDNKFQVLATDISDAYRTFWDERRDVEYLVVDMSDNDALEKLKSDYTDGKGFDLIHVRFINLVLTPLRWPDQIVEWSKLLKIGGTLQIEEFDITHPSYLNAFLKSLESEWGAAAQVLYPIASNLATFFNKAGLDSVVVESFTLLKYTFEDPDTLQDSEVFKLTIGSIKELIVKSGLEKGRTEADSRKLVDDRWDEVKASAQGLDMFASVLMVSGQRKA